MIAAALLCVLVLATTSGCAAVADPLAGTSWRLTGWSVSSIDPASVTITASFKDGRIGGTSGVNSYGGLYSIGPGGSIAIGALSSTLMAGPEPAMRAEAAYDTLLSQVASFKIADGKLTLLDKGGNESLIFAPSK